MKKILFVMPHLDCGGGEKALVSLLDSFKHPDWQIDLFLFEDWGLFRKFVPEHVRVIPRDNFITQWNTPLLHSIGFFLKNKNWRLAIKRLIFKCESMLCTTPESRFALVWKYYQILLPRLPIHYDVAVGYMEGTANYYVAEMIMANRKIGYMHNDYERLAHRNRELDLRHYEKMDAVVTVSEGCKQGFQQIFPSIKNNIRFVENVVSPDLIKKWAAYPPDPYGDNFSGIRILIIGRLTHQKGIDLAADACRILKDRGYSIRWYVLGDGEERAALTQQINVLSIQNDFILLGNRANPYPFIAKCDIYAQPSRWEGWGIAIEEAKILNKPIILTRFVIADTRVESMKTGLIVDLTPEALAEGITKLIDNPLLLETFSKNLKENPPETGKAIHQFYQLLDAENR